MKTYGGEKVLLQAFVTSVLDGAESWASRTRYFILRDRAVDIRGIGGWLGPIIGLGALESRVSSPPTEQILKYFMFCWLCISSQILVNNQPDASFHVFIYSFHLSTCFEHQVPIIRTSNCINTSSGMISLCDCLVCWSGGNCSSLLTGIQSSHLHRLIIPDDVLIQFDVLMMGTWCSKHVERWNE